MKSFDSLKVEHKNAQDELVRVQTECVAKKEKENQQLQAENKKLEEELVALRASMEELKTRHETEKSSLVEEAIRDYQKSNEYFEAKGAFGSGFLKVGFYMARQHLEKVRQEKFPELFYTDEFEDGDFPDWKALGYALYDTNLATHLYDSLHDDLSNLSGPWEFYGKNGVRSSSPALDVTLPTSGSEL
ncbi:MAG: hypothetical protein Q8881_04215, partial [Sweet potato little leaf phytoplasma]|nr:hypothetical protein [Sweet potato little leaf phytoplasma]